MGYRMTIWPENDHDGWVGDDHKLYGYIGYDEVSSSFSYLFIKWLIKYGGDTYKLCLDFNNPAREAYSVFITGSVSPEICLSEDEFDVFMGLYLSDLSRAYPFEQSDIKRIEGYMDKMSNTPGNKILQWS